VFAHCEQSGIAVVKTVFATKWLNNVFSP